MDLAIKWRQNKTNKRYDKQQIPQGRLMTGDYIMKIIIYGAGNCGRYVYNKVIDNTHIDMPFWIDNSLKGGQEIFGKPVISETDFKKLSNEKDVVIIIAIMDDNIRQKICLSLNNSGYSEIYLLDQHCLMADLPLINENGEFRPWVRRFDTIKPVLPYLEFQVADRCNLNCTSCAHFSNIYKEDGFPEPQLFRSALEILSNRLSNIGKIRLMGGEPLLNEQLPEFIEIARDVFPQSDIRVVTNGIQLFNISDRLKDVMQRTVTIFDITQYPVIQNRLADIMEYLSSLRIGYQLSPMTDQFWIRTTTGNSLPEKAFLGNACSSVCTFLRKGRLFVCPQIPLLYENRGLFDFHIDEDEYLSASLLLSENMLENGWDILKCLLVPKKFCRFCSYDFEWVDWSCGTTDFNKNNYLIKDISK